MFALNHASRDNIQSVTGLTVDQIANMDFDDIDAHIRRKVGHKITDYLVLDVLPSRGQVYADSKRFINMENIDRML